MEKLTRLQQITSLEVELFFQSVSKLIKTRERGSVTIGRIKLFEKIRKGAVIV